MTKYIRHWDRETINDGIDDGSFLKRMITNDTHLTKHTHNTESQNLDRIILERKKAQSLFTDNINNTHEFDKNHKYAMDLIDIAIWANKSQITDWMMNALDGEKQPFHMKFDSEKDDIVGTGMIFDNSTNTIKEYATKHMTFVLKRDMTQPNGFYMITAYPDFDYHDIEPTGRDLTPFIKESQAYKNGDDVYKTYLRYTTDVNNNHLVTYRQGYTPDDSVMMIRMNTENPDIYHEIKIKQNQMTLRTIKKEYDDRGRTIEKTPIRTDYNTLYESQTGRTKTKYVDFNNESVFQKFVKEYPEMEKPLTNIRNHFNETHLQNTYTTHFDATRTMSNISHENVQNRAAKTSKTQVKPINNAQHTYSDVQPATPKCPTPPARMSTSKLERIASDVSTEDDKQFE